MLTKTFMKNQAILFTFMCLQAALFQYGCEKSTVEAVETKQATFRAATESTVPWVNHMITFTRPNGPYSKTDYVGDFGNDFNQNGSSTMSSSYVPRMRIANNSWQVKLLKNQIGNAGGMWTYTAIPKNTRRKVLEYDVKFGDDTSTFQWSMGGKIPGLGGGKNYSGCVSTTAGDGWTSRIMWRTDTLNRAYLMPYVYYVDKPARCGDDFGKRYFSHDGAGLKNNQWYHIKMEITLNTGTSHNGALKIFVQELLNGVWSEPEALIEKTDIRYATQSAGLEIDQVLTGVYRGGSTLAWAASTDGYIYFDNFTWHD